jgi:hypothetical protein
MKPFLYPRYDKPATLYAGSDAHFMPMSQTLSEDMHADLAHTMLPSAKGASLNVLKKCVEVTPFTRVFLDPKNVEFMQQSAGLAKNAAVLTPPFAQACLEVIKKFQNVKPTERLLRGAQERCIDSAIRHGRVAELEERAHETYSSRLPAAHMTTQSAVVEPRRRTEMQMTIDDETGFTFEEYHGKVKEGSKHVGGHEFVMQLRPRPTMDDASVEL